jgi:RHS repeat-associated protein
MKALAAVLAILTLSASVASGQEVVEYYHLDAIGNVRAVSNQANVVTERHDYLPFGEECTTGPCANNPGAGAGQPRKFTSKERDQESGLDYFGARYYGSRIARFTTVDPVYTWRDNLLDPQRWNRYAYGRDNPLRYVDPDGRAGRDVTGADVAKYYAAAVAAHKANPKDDPFGLIVQGGTALVALAPLVVLAAEAAPVILTEALIAGGRCGVSAGCRGFIEDVADSVSGVPSPRLNQPQAQNLARFNKKLPAGNTGTHVDELGEGVLFTAEVPGRVPGSKAVYQKAVDEAGETTNVVKTTFDPKGNVVHVKDKMPLQPN